MSIIQAPGGRRFDTVRRVFVDESIGETSPQSRQTTSSSNRYRSHNNIWESINDFITDIGDWFEDHASAFSSSIAMIYYYGSWITLVIGIIAQWINSGFGSALLTAVIGSIIVFYCWNWFCCSYVCCIDIFLDFEIRFL
jgi:hypothetical protein